jgi:hypothetical protein
VRACLGGAWGAENERIVKDQKGDVYLEASAGNDCTSHTQESALKVTFRARTLREMLFGWPTNVLTIKMLQSAATR